MALAKSMKQILSGNEAKLEVSLVDAFGVPIEDVALREAIGQKIIDKIRDNAENAKFINPPSGKNQNYSDSYAESDAFKAYGKSKGDVNMTQTGDMLGLMDIISQSPDKIVIGWRDSLQAQKAHGHVTGSVGVTRNFLGLSGSDMDAIKNEFLSDIPSGPGGSGANDIMDAISLSWARNEPGTKQITARELFRRIEDGDIDQDF